VELEISIEIEETRDAGVQRLPIEDGIVLGRGLESPTVLDGPLISGEHIAVEVVGGSQCGSGRRYPVNEVERVQVPGV
jgi:hypothetical protein